MSVITRSRSPTAISAYEQKRSDRPFLLDIHLFGVQYKSATYDITPTVKQVAIAREHVQKI